MATRDQHDEWVCGGNRRIGVKMTPTLNNIEVVRIDNDDEQCPCPRRPPPTSFKFSPELTQYPRDVSALNFAARVARS